MTARQRYIGRREGRLGGGDAAANALQAEMLAVALEAIAWVG